MGAPSVAEMIHRMDNRGEKRKTMTMTTDYRTTLSATAPTSYDPDEMNPLGVMIAETDATSSDATLVTRSTLTPDKHVKSNIFDLGLTVRDNSPSEQVFAPVVDKTTEQSTKKESGPKVKHYWAG